MEKHLLVLIFQVILFFGFYLGLTPDNSIEYGLYITITLAILQLALLIYGFKNNDRKWISVFLMVISFGVALVYYTVLGLMSAYG